MVSSCSASARSCVSSRWREALAIGGLLLNDRVVNAVHLLLGLPHRTGRTDRAGAGHVAVGAGLPVLDAAATAGRADGRGRCADARNGCAIPRRAAVPAACIRRVRHGAGGFRVPGDVVRKLQVVDHDDYAKRSKPIASSRAPWCRRAGWSTIGRGACSRTTCRPTGRRDPEDAGDIERLVDELSRIVALSPQEIERFHRERRATRSFRSITLAARQRRGGGALRGGPVEIPRRRSGASHRRYLHGACSLTLRRAHRRERRGVTASRRCCSCTPAAPGWSVTTTRACAVASAEQVETNVEGRAIRTIGMVPAQAGADLRLSVDLELQRAMVLAFGEMHGSAVAVDPKTGRVLGMVSLPSFDANLFVNGISHDDYRRLMDDPARPLFNRTVLVAARRIDDQAARGAGRRGQRPAHARRAACSRPASFHPRPATQLSRCRGRRWLGRPARFDRARSTTTTTSSPPDGHRALRRIHAALRFRAADRHRPDRRERGRGAVAAMEGAAQPQGWYPARP